MHTRTLDELYTSRGDMNLTGAVIRFSVDATPPINEIYERCIFPHIHREIPAASYAGANIAHLRNLFLKTKKANLFSNEDFKVSYKKLITEPIEKFYDSELGIEEALWGAWYVYEDEEESLRPLNGTTFTAAEREALLDILLSSEEPEAIAYALNVSAGLTIKEAMSARVGDLRPDSEGRLAIHTMGTFPKLSIENASDTRPRSITLNEPLSKALVKICNKKKGASSFIAERGGSYCHLQDLHFYARDVLKDQLGLNEMRLSKAEYSLLSDPLKFARERSPEYEMGRRTFAAALHKKGLAPSEINYLMGFAPEENTYEEGGQFPSAYAGALEL